MSEAHSEMNEIFLAVYEPQTVQKALETEDSITRIYMDRIN